MKRLKTTGSFFHMDTTSIYFGKTYCKKMMTFSDRVFEYIFSFFGPSVCLWHAYMSASGPRSHWRALSALSSWLVYSRKLGVSGMYWAVIKSMTGAPAQTSASWRQSNLAPIANADKSPICDATLVAEHRLPRMEGWAISLMYNWDVN